MKVRVISKERFQTFLVGKGSTLDMGLALFRTSTGNEVYIDKVSLSQYLGREVEGEWKLNNNFDPTFLTETGHVLLSDMIENKMRYCE